MNTNNVKFCYLLLVLMMSCTDPKTTTTTPNGEGSSPGDSLASDTIIDWKFTTGIRSMLEDSHGNLWFGSNSEGAARYDGDTLIYFTTEDGLSDKQVRHITEGADGKIWFEGGQGISVYDGTSLSIHTERDYRHKNEWSTATDDLWFKGDATIGYNAQEGQAGAYRYDGERMIFQAFPSKEEDEGSDNYSVSATIAKGKDGRIWIATYDAVIGYDGSTFTFIDGERLGLDSGSEYLHVRSIFEDSQENLWLGNNGIGVIMMTGDSATNFSTAHDLRTKLSDKPINRPASGGLSPTGTLEHVFVISEDRNGNIWFGDRDTGAWRFDGTSLTNYTMEDGLTSQFVTDIYEDRQGDLWFAMDNGTVCRFNGTSFDTIFASTSIKRMPTIWVVEPIE